MLFESDSYIPSKQVSHIYAKLAELFNFPVKTKCKYYKDSCELIQSIYNGTFLTKYRIDLRRAKDCNVENNNSIILECKGNWNKTRSLILNSYNNLLLIRNEEYLPYGKKFWNELKLSSYFGGQIGMFYNCPFYCLISEPFTKQEYFNNKTINEIKEHLKQIKFNSILATANVIQKEAKFNKRDTYNYWIALKDLTDWWERVKKLSPMIYSSLKSTFQFPNLLADYYEWLKEMLIDWQGGHYILSPWYFKAGESQDGKLSGQFSKYILSKVKNNQVLKSLPKSIVFYYDETSFNDKNKMIEKEIIEEEIVF